MNPTMDVAKNYAQALVDIFSNADYSGSTTRYKNPQECWDRFEAMLEHLGRPGAGLKIVHIAGTNGKGTTSALCERMLRESGVRVGLFTSPHMHSFRERIRIDGALVSQDAVVRAMPRLRAASEAVGGSSPFEKLTALALLCFDDAKLEWAVLETGLGGRWDATNHATPAVCGITRIGFDHMNVLGSTLHQIAGEKAGIIKRGVPAFSVPQEPEAAAVLRSAAAAAGTNLTGDAPLEPAAALPEWLRLPHQAHNAALAMALVRSLAARGLLRDDADARARAVTATRWPARFEMLRPGLLRGARLVLDVAHNQPAIRALVDSLSAPPYAGAKLAVVLGVNKDKDLAAIVHEMRGLGPRVSGFVAVASSHPKATTASEVARIAVAQAPALAAADGGSAPPWRVAGSMAEALELAAALLTAQAAPAADAIVLCCGSVFIAAEMREEIARTDPALFADDDWVLEEREPPLVM